MKVKQINAAIVGGKEKFKLVDLLRGLASICILFVHYRHFFMGATPIGSIDSIKNVPSFFLWEPIYLYGANVVQLFWLCIYTCLRRPRKHRLEKIWGKSFCSFVSIAFFNITNSPIVTII